MNTQSAPVGERLHIGLFGRRNSGKSSLMNALTRQEISLVSETPGVTTDPVYKAMEIHGVGPCVFIDTAGFDDEGDLGKMRIEKTRDVLQKTDIAILLFDDGDHDSEREWIDLFKDRNIPFIPVVSRCDEREDVKKTVALVERETGASVFAVSSRTREGIDSLIERIGEVTPNGFTGRKIVGNTVSAGDVVLLVMPQDIQAPKGRLILPQVQTIRELLDGRCITVCATTAELPGALAALRQPPALIITDSQAFSEVYAQKPPESKITSFSVLFAAKKGDIDVFIAGARAVDRLTPDSHVLIAEACSHVPLEEDIGREKIPAMLRKRIGKNLRFSIVSGTDFPTDLTGYDLVIHCGGCMFNRRYVTSRVERAVRQGVPITNYGVIIAYLSGILDKIVY